MKKSFIKKCLLMLSIVSILNIFTIKPVKSTDNIDSETISKINRISEENIQKFKRSFDIKERFNNKIFWGTTGLSTVGIGGVLIYWMTQKSAKSKDLDECFNNFSTSPPATQNILKQLAQAGLANAKSVKNILDKREDSWSTTAVNWTKSNAKNVCWALASYVAWKKTTEFINPYLPNTAKMGDKIGSSRTLNWFIDHNTSLNQIIKDIVNFLEAQDASISTNINTDTKKQDLASILNLFVNNIEKILGFMEYNSDLIVNRDADNLDNNLVNNRVKIIISKIKKLTNNLLDLAKTDQVKNIKLYINTLKELINTFESFSVVQEMALDYQDAIPRNTFKKLRFILEHQRLKKDVEKSSKELEDLKILKGLLAENSI